MMPYCQLDPKGHISVKFYLKFESSHSRKCAWTCRLWNGGHFFSASMCQCIKVFIQTNTYGHGKHCAYPWRWLHPDLNFCQFCFLMSEWFWDISKANDSPGGCLNIKMPSYQYRDSHVKDKTVSPTVLSLTWDPHTWKRQSLYWDRALMFWRKSTLTCSTKDSVHTYCTVPCSQLEHQNHNSSKFLSHSQKLNNILSHRNFTIFKHLIYFDIPVLSNL